VSRIVPATKRAIKNPEKASLFLALAHRGCPGKWFNVIAIVHLVTVLMYAIIPSLFYHHGLHKNNNTRDTELQMYCKNFNSYNNIMLINITDHLLQMLVLNL